MLTDADEDRRSFLTWLGPVQHDDRYEACRACRTRATCSWVFDTDFYSEWISSVFPEDTGKLLWIHGPAGFGKSVLCAAIVESLEINEALQVSHFFCTSAYVKEENSTTILRSWIAQIVTHDDDLLDLAREHIRRCFGHASWNSLWTLFSLLVRKISDHVFVVDGLDECDVLDNDHREPSTQSRLNFLVQLGRSIESTSARVLVVSRDEPDIGSVLGSKASRNSHLNFYEHEILRDDVEADVLIFSKSVADIKLPNKSDSVKSEIAEQMTNICEGMFLWVELQSRYLRGGKSKEQLQKVLGGLPVGLDAIYEKSWRGILNKPRDEKSRALKILRWATFAARPLTVSEITEALIVPEDDTCEELLTDLPDCIDHEYVNDEIIGLCGSLIEVRHTHMDQSLETATIHLKHFSIKQFLLTRKTHEMIVDIQYRTPSDQGIENNYLAASCLKYLQQRIENVSIPLIRNQSFLDYTIQFWHQHLSLKGSRYQEVQSLVDEFFKPGNGCWNSWRVRYEKIEHRKNFTECQNTESFPNQLYYAAWLGLRDTVDHLHQKYPNMLNSIGGMYGTPIQAACAENHSSLFMHLIDLGARVDTLAGHFGSVLGAAAHNGNLDICRYILDTDATIAMPDGQNRDPALLASRSGMLRRFGYYRIQALISFFKDYFGFTPLHTACQNGYVDVVNLLLDREADVEIIDNDGWTPLYTACVNGRLEIVKLLLNRGADFTMTSHFKFTPLHAASQKGHFEILLNRGANFAIANKDGWTPLHSACQNGHFEIVKLLLDRGADLTITDDYEWTPFYVACQNGHNGIVKLLLDRGADLATLSNKSTPLHAACRNGHIEVIKLLLNRGADLTIPRNGPPLYTASQNGHIEVVALLLDRGADLTITDDYEWTSLFVACQKAHIEVAKLLLDQGADLTIIDNIGHTPLQIACFFGHVEMVRLLLDRGANFASTKTIDKGWTPLFVACQKGHIEVAKLLLARGADLTVTNDNGCTPLYVASQYDHIGVAELLLDQKADLTSFDNDGWTSLHLACFNGHVEMARLFLDRGADLTAKTNAGYTSLHSACKNGHVEIINLLLNRGADLTIKINNGWTSLHLACSNGSVEVTRLLLDRGADLTAKTNDGYTSLLLACKNGHVKIVNVLLDRGSDPTTQNNFGWTSLHVAADGGNLEIINSLLGNATDLEHVTKLSETALHLASRRDMPEIVGQLIAHGCDHLKLDDYGRTCQDWASMYRPCFLAASNQTNQYTPTSKITSLNRLKKTINRLINATLLETVSMSFYQLGHCLLFIGDEQNACRAFEQIVSSTITGIQEEVHCDRCSSGNICRARYVCKSCANCDLCQPCFQVFREHEKPWRCQSHEFIRIPREGIDMTEELIKERKENVNDWLREVQKMHC